MGPCLDQGPPRQEFDQANPALPILTIPPKGDVLPVPAGQHLGDPQLGYLGQAVHCRVLEVQLVEIHPGPRNLEHIFFFLGAQHIVAVTITGQLLELGLETVKTVGQAPGVGQGHRGPPGFGGLVRLAHHSAPCD